jgi:hypothetical protein
MKIRLIGWMALGALLFGCREQAKPQSEVALPEPVATPVWTPLTGKWQQVEGGEVTEDKGILRLDQGYSLTGARWQGSVPEIPFEFEAEARRVLGSDFFFSLTFPGRDENESASLIVGGWGGGLVGISSIDGLDASENETCEFLNFENDRWYPIRLRVTQERIEAWIDGNQVIDVSIIDRRLSLRLGPIEECAPFGVATYATTGEMRNMRWRAIRSD